MIKKQINNCIFELKEEHDFSWLSNLGTVFEVFAEQDSGNIAFGTDDGIHRLLLNMQDV